MISMSLQQQKLLKQNETKDLVNHFIFKNLPYFWSWQEKDSVQTAVKQIRWVFGDKWRIIFYSSP